MLSSKRATFFVGVLGIAVLVAVLTAALAGGTTALAGGSGHASQKTANKHYKIFAMVPIVGVAYTIALKKGVLEGAKSLGDTATYTGPTTLSPTTQVTMLDAALRQGYQGILVGPDDPATLLPLLKRAEAKGIKVITFGADLTTPSDRIVYVSPPDYKTFSYGMVQWLGEEIGYKGQIAFLSSNTTKLDQVTWIKYMKQALATPKYRGMKLVKIAYGNEVPSQDVAQTNALLEAYPNLKGIISPTAVGLPDVARAVTTAGKCGKVQISGLALPSTMKTYVASGCEKVFGIWSPIDLGYLAVYAMQAALDGKLTGKVGESFNAGRLGTRTVVMGPSGTSVLVGPPEVVTKANINKFGF